MLATERISGDADYMSSEHTVGHMRRELHVPDLAPPDSYESWLNAGGRDIIDYATDRANQMLTKSHTPPLPDDLQRELDKYVQARQRDLSDGRVPGP